jgi:hypothetical protein
MAGPNTIFFGLWFFWKSVSSLSWNWDVDHVKQAAPFSLVRHRRVRGVLAMHPSRGSSLNSAPGRWITVASIQVNYTQRKAFISAKPARIRSAGNRSVHGYNADCTGRLIDRLSERDISGQSLADISRPSCSRDVVFPPSGPKINPPPAEPNNALLHTEIKHELHSIEEILIEASLRSKRWILKYVPWP